MFINRSTSPLSRLEIMHRALDEVDSDDSKKDESRVSPNVSLVEAIDISHLKETAEEKASRAQKPPSDAVAGEDIASLKKKLIPIKVSKRKKWKKPKDKPKRPLSAYNLFFQFEREKLLHGDAEPQHVVATMADREEPEGRADGRIGFAALAKDVASKWKTLDAAQKVPFEEQALKEKERYKVELDQWKETQAKRKKEADDWAVRREEVIRSLSNMNSEHERTERALQAAVSLHDATALSQRYNDSLANHHLQSRQQLQQPRQLSQYDQMLLNDSILRQRFVPQQDRGSYGLPTMASNSTESVIRRLQEASPMDFYSRMIYSGTADVAAADAMHSYLNAQFAAAGRSLGVSNDTLSALGASITGDALSPSLPAAVQGMAISQVGNLSDGALRGLGLPSYGYGTGSMQQHQNPHDVLQEMAQMSPQDMSYLYGDDDYDLVANLHKGANDGRRPPR